MPGRDDSKERRSGKEATTAGAESNWDLSRSMVRNHDLSAFYILGSLMFTDVHCWASHATQYTFWERWNLRNPLTKLSPHNAQCMKVKSRGQLRKHQTYQNIKRVFHNAAPEMVTLLGAQGQALQKPFMWPENHSPSAHSQGHFVRKKARFN